MVLVHVLGSLTVLAALGLAIVAVGLEGKE